MKNLEQITTVAYFHFILFRMHERVIVTEIKHDIAIQMAVVHLLAQKTKESAKWKRCNNYQQIHQCECCRTRRFSAKIFSVTNFC